MSDFSIEMTAEKIIDARTRKYFGEVLQCYNSGCFRSAVVMLWSVVVCDLLFKLDHLANAYADPTAKSILKDIEKLRLQNPKSPDWEWTLVEEIVKRTQLLEASDEVNLKTLQDHRHLSAHPVLTSTEVLFSPSREVVRAHVRNTLEGVLTKPAMFSKKVFDALTEDLETNEAVLPDENSLERYLGAKYFPHFVPHVENGVFRSLWRLTFKSTDARCERARSILYRTLCILYQRRPAEIMNLIETDRPYFSELHFSGTALAYLWEFLGKRPQVYSLLTEAAKTPLSAIANGSINEFASGWFMSSSVERHLDAILVLVGQKNYMSKDAFANVAEVAREAGCLRKAIEIGIAHYVGSSDFESADGYFQSMVKPYLENYDEPQLISLLQGIEDNDQCYIRRRSKRDHKQIKEQVDKVLGNKFNPDAYRNFVESLGEEPVPSTPPPPPPPAPDLPPPDDDVPF